eukprot:CAMPEP_0176009314 /NCGR_PEP_ID=MMETSP0120_2-20121206/4188_1 /TAXON_ID=160619 /ORGANISM="Kryptoperidinium foliaceum, Strain CCMP 1326" /LENGTH=194 /DNA_ID=CAMNT_0017342109 /DNA_START=119 /DNA_END=703 /DNA_ORIENTATION=+
MMNRWMKFLTASLFMVAATAFSTTTHTTPKASTTALQAEQNEDLMRWARASRSASSDDNVVELMRPLGLVLNQDDNGNVYVETVAPKGNAARTGKVKEGDIVTMCSATFGEDMWSTRGVGLTRVLAAIRVRAGPTVKLVFESPNAYKKKAAMSTAQRKAADDARQAAQAKKDALLAELENDEKKIKKGKFFGLF